MSESQTEYLWQELLKSFDDEPEVVPEPEAAPVQPPPITQQLFPPLSPSITSQPPAGPMTESQMEDLWQELLKSLEDKPEVAPEPEVVPEPEAAPVAPVQPLSMPISSPQPPPITQQIFPPLSPSITSQPLSPPALSASQLNTLLEELQEALKDIPELQNQSGK